MVEQELTQQAPTSGTKGKTAVADELLEPDAVAEPQNQAAGQSVADRPDESGRSQPGGGTRQSSSGPETPPLPDFSEMLSEAATGSIDLLKDVDLNVKIELGRAEMTVENVLRLAVGAVVELNKLAGDPVDVFVNDQLVAHGEVLVLNDNFCVRINEIIPGLTEKLAKQ